MQAQAWITEIGENTKSYAAQIHGNMDHPEPDDPKEVEKLRNILMSYADQKTQEALKSDPLNVSMVIFFSQEEYRNDPQNVRIDGFEIHDNLYEVLKESFKKYLK